MERGVCISTATLTDEQKAISNIMGWKPKVFQVSGDTQVGGKRQRGGRVIRRGRQDHPKILPYDAVDRTLRGPWAAFEKKVNRELNILVTHWDREIFEVLRKNQSDSLRSYFPEVPIDWPSEWGSTPIGYPIFLSLHRLDLVKSPPNSGLWEKAKQLFVEQLAGGWHLDFQETKDRCRKIPTDMVKMILTNGGMHFAGPRYLEVLRYLHNDYSTAVDVSQRELYQTRWSYINSKIATESRRSDEGETLRMQRKYEKAVLRTRLLRDIPVLWLRDTGGQMTLPPTQLVEWAYSLKMSVDCYSSILYTLRNMVTQGDYTSDDIIHQLSFAPTIRTYQEWELDAREMIGEEPQKN